MKNKRMLGNAMLLLTALIWGTAFVSQRVGMESIEPITFNAARMALAAIAVGTLAVFLSRREKSVFPSQTEERRDRNRNTVIGGVCCGIFLTAASIMQQMGLVYTAAGKAGFITAMYMLLVPLIRSALGGTGFCWLAASLLLALQGTPAMTLVMHGAVRTHAAQTRLTAASLGLTEVQHLSRVALPLSSRAMLSAAVLGLGRAVGDALLPAMLAGNAIRFARSPLDSIRTLTSHISLVLSSDIGGGEHLSLLLAGALLLIFCAAVSLTARRLTRRNRS